MENKVEQQKEIKRDSLKKSSIFNITIKLLTYLIPLILSPYVYRVLTFSGVGSFTYQNAYVNYFTLVAAFGFADYGTKRISTATKNPDELNRRFWSVFFSKQFLGVGCLLVYFIMVFCHVFGDSSNDIAYVIFALNILSTMLDVSFFYQGIENFKAIAIRSAIIKVINLILIFCLVKSPDDYLTYVGIMCGCAVLSSLIMFLPLRKYIKKPTFNIKMMGMDVKNATLFFISALAISLYTTMDSTILGLMKGDSAVGYFSSASKIKDVVTSINYAIIPVIFSRMSFLISQGKDEEAKNLIYKTFNVIMDITLPCVLGIICVADVFMPLYFGSDGSNAVLMMDILALSLPFIAFSSIINYSYIIPKEKMKLSNAIYLCAGILNIIVVYLLVKFIGKDGIAYAVLFTEAFVAIVFIYYSHLYIDFKKVIKTMIKPLDASLIMAVVYLLGNKVLTKFISANKAMVLMIVVSVIVYSLFLYLFKDEFAYPLANKYLAKIKSKFISIKTKIMKKEEKK